MAELGVGPVVGTTASADREDFVDLGRLGQSGREAGVDGSTTTAAMGFLGEDLGAELAAAMAVSHSRVALGVGHHQFLHVVLPRQNR
jgi:hypothetical protein